MGDAAKRGQLFEQLIRIVGTPGSGKTTLATLLEARMVEACLGRSRKGRLSGDYSSAGRLSLQWRMASRRSPLSGYPWRANIGDFWELPYDDALKTKLVLALIQARGAGPSPQP